MALFEDLLIATDGLDAPPAGISLCRDGDAHLQRKMHRIPPVTAVL